MEPIELTVDQPYGDLLEYLAGALPDVPLNVLRRLIARGRVEADGRRVAHDFAPQAGQQMVVHLPETPFVHYEPQEMPLEVLYESADALVVSKPAGITVLPEQGSLEARLINGLLHYVRNASPFPCVRVHVVHRLDRGTSGALIFAKTVAAARHLSSCFEERRVLKHYLALVRGEVATEEGEVDLPIAQHTRGRMRLRRRRGRPASSRYRVVERFRGFTLVQVQPLTGRMHQVRLHMSGIGHPLAVDPLYGGREALFLSEIKPGYRKRRERPESPLIARLTLHAQRLALDLPDGERLDVEAPLPRDLERLLTVLRKYAK